MKIDISQEGEMVLRSLMKPGETFEDFLQRFLSEHYEMMFTLMKIEKFTINLLENLSVLRERGLLPDESEIPNLLEILKILRGQGLTPDEPESQNPLEELYAEMGTDLAFNFETLPGWAIAWIDEKKIPLSFKKGDLTQEQEKELELFMGAVGLWMEGLIHVEYQEGEGVVMYWTENGKEMYKNLEEAEG